MFGQKQKKLAREIKQASEEAWEKLRVEINAQPAPSGPLADLCQDIRENPAEYGFSRTARTEKEWADERLTHHDDHFIEGPAFLSRKEYSWCLFKYYAAWGQLTVQSEIDLAAATFATHQEYRASCKKADVAARLATLKEKRESPFIEPMDIHDLTERRAKALSDSAIMGREFDMEERDALAAIIGAMLPVLEGTHKIVEVTGRPFAEMTVEEQKCIAEAAGGTLEANGRLSVPLKHPVTIETVTPGDNRPVMRDFSATQEGPFQQGDGMGIKTVFPPHPVLAGTPGGVVPLPERDKQTPEGQAVVILVHPGERYLWIDHEGQKHPTDKARGEANRLIEAKRRTQKAGAE